MKFLPTFCGCYVICAGLLFFSWLWLSNLWLGLGVCALMLTIPVLVFSEHDDRIARLEKNAAKTPGRSRLRKRGRNRMHLRFKARARAL